MRQKFWDLWLGFSGDEINDWLIKCGFKIEKTEYFNLKKDLTGFLIKSIKI